MVSFENIESVPLLSNDVCAVNLEPGVSANTIVSDVKTDDAVPSTGTDKKSSQGELCYGVSNEEIEEVLSDDLELQEDF